jgi:hypothetical protein
MRRLTAIVVLLVTLLAGAGCASTGSAAGDNAMGGYELELFVHRDENAFALYHVRPDGMLSFAGGYDAVNRDFSWSGQLTETEREQLLELIRGLEWFETPFVSSGTPPQWRYRIDIRRPREGRRFTVDGRHPRIEPVRELLATAAARRNEQFMRSLPEPGLQQ